MDLSLILTFSFFSVTMQKASLMQRASFYWNHVVWREWCPKWHVGFLWWFCWTRCEGSQGIAVVRLELAKHQLDIVDSLVGWDGICRYVVAMRNLHGKKFGKTPRELLRDSPASKENPVSAMFCSQVLAETPESVKSIGRRTLQNPKKNVNNRLLHQ